MRISKFAVRCAVIMAATACGATPPTAPDAELVPTAPMTEVTRSQNGSFTGLSNYQVSGQVRLVVRDTLATLELGSDFRASAVPGPFLYLNTTTDVNRGTPLRISALRSNAGAQTYTFRIPTGVAYTQVLIWCDPFNVGVGAAALTP